MRNDPQGDQVQGQDVRKELLYGGFHSLGIMGPHALPIQGAIIRKGDVL